jgi:hypothetical protein
MRTSSPVGVPCVSLETMAARPHLYPLERTLDRNICFPWKRLDKWLKGLDDRLIDGAETRKQKFDGLDKRVDGVKCKTCDDMHGCNEMRCESVR